MSGSGSSARSSAYFRTPVGALPSRGVADAASAALCLLSFLAFPRLPLGLSEPLPHELGANHVTLGRRQLASGEPLQMRRLSQNQEFVDPMQRAEVGHAKCHAQNDQELSRCDL